MSYTYGRTKVAIGLEATGVTAAANGSGSAIPADATTIPYDTLSGGNFSKKELLKIIKAGTNNEMLLALEDDGSQLTVAKRGIFLDNPQEIADDDVLTEYKFKVQGAINDKELTLEPLSKTLDLKNEDGVIDTIFLPPDELLTFNANFAEYTGEMLKKVYNLHEDVDGDITRYMIRSQDGELLSDHTEPAIMYLRAYGDKMLAIFFPKVGIKKFGNLSFQEEGQLSIPATFAALPTEIDINGKPTMVYGFWSIIKP